MLAIGVDKYRIERRALKYAVRDAVEFGKSLEVVGSTLFAKVETTVLKDEEVTEAAIAAAFKRIGADAKVGDAFEWVTGSTTADFGSDRPRAPAGAEAAYYCAALGEPAALAA